MSDISNLGQDQWKWLNKYKSISLEKWRLIELIYLVWAEINVIPGHLGILNTLYSILFRESQLEFISNYRLVELSRFIRTY